MYKFIHMKTNDIFFFSIYLLQKIYVKGLFLRILKKRGKLNINKINVLQINKTT